jgi:ABC-type multidrug transport system fused ATPase/permease subunit
MTLAEASFNYPLLNVFLSFLYFFVFVIWIFLIFTIFTDLFRSHDVGGWGKTFWVLLILVLPLLGVLIYLIVRGGSMHERAEAAAASQQAAMQEYIQQAAGTSPSVADELEKLAALRDNGTISAEDFAAQKARLLG